MRASSTTEAGIPAAHEPPAARTGRLARFRRACRRVVLFVVLTLAIQWAALALAIDGPGRVVAAGFVALSLVLLLQRRRRRTLRAIWGVLFALVLVWWLSLTPRNDREWQPDVARLTSARLEGGELVLTNVRNFEWTGAEQGVPRWEERRYALADVRGVDLVLSDWGASLIVHTILTWEFAGGEHLAISIETRKEVGEGYSAVRGLFRRFELYYTVADERDVLGVRAAFRGERLRLYRLDLTPEEAAALLVVYAARVDELALEPAWYNALTANCTNSIRLHAQELGAASPWDWRLLANGRVDEMLYERGRLGTTLPFAELRERCDVTDEARAALGAPDFSARIRAGLPERPR